MKQVKILFGIMIFVGVLLGIVRLWEQINSNTVSVSVEAGYTKTWRSLNPFCLQGISWYSYKESDLLFRLRADKIVPRNFHLGSLIFFNLKEIYISNLKLELYPTEGFTAKGLFHAWECVMNTVGDTLTDMRHKVSPTTQRPSDTDSEFTVRVAMEKVMIFMYLQSRSHVRLSADKATLQDQRKIVFKGNFLGVSSDGTHITAPEAELLTDYNGLYFPKGYMLKSPGHSQVSKETFVTVSQAGQFMSSSECPAIEHTLTEFDNIEKNVNIFFSKMIPRFFPYPFLQNRPWQVRD